MALPQAIAMILTMAGAMQHAQMYPSCKYSDTSFAFEISTCEMCLATVAEIQTEIQDPHFTDRVVQAIDSFCRTFGDGAEYTMCDSMLEYYVFDSLYELEKMDPIDVCSSLYVC